MNQSCVNIATYPARESVFQKNINCFLNLNPKPTQINVCLNDYSEIPIWMKSLPFNFILTKGGAENKFYYVKDFVGYYLMCDDDFVYPSNYVQKMIDGVDFYNQKAFVGIHGGKYNKWPINRYLTDLHFYMMHDELKSNRPVHILSSGTAAFHTSIARGLGPDVFLTSNMTDPYLSKWCIEHNIPMYVLTRPKKYVFEYPGSQSGPCIWKDAWKDKNNIRTSIINSISNFPLKLN